MNSNQIVYRTIVMKGTSEGLDKVAADLNKVAAAHQGVTVASEKTEKSSLSLEQALQRQRLRLDELARAQNNIERERKIADKGLREGKIDQQQHNELMSLATQRYATTSKATAEFGKQTGLARHELINLGRQAQDVGVSLVSGQSPLMVLAQQGSQIADVFATSGGTVRGFFSQAIGWAARFAASAAGVVTGVTAIGAAALYMGASFAAAQREIDKGLAGGGGAASGMTRGGINRIAEQAAGGGMSIAEAREAATAFAATGKIYEQNIAAATNVTRDFARAMGIDAADATKQLAAALLDPSKGALELNKQIAFLDTTTLAYIRSLQTQGDLQGAQKALLDAAAGAAKKQADEVGGLSAAWNKAVDWITKYDDARNKMLARGMGAAPAPLEDQLAGARQTQQTAQGALGNAQELGLGPRAMKALEEAARAAGVEVARLEQKLADLAKQTESQRLLQLSEEARAYTNAIIPAIAEVDNLTKAIKKLEEAKAAGKGGPNVDAALTVAAQLKSVAQETIAVEERKAAINLQLLETYNTQSIAVARTLAQQKDQLAVAQAVGVPAQLQAQEQARYNQLVRDQVAEQDAARVAAGETAIAQAQINSNAQLTLLSLRDQEGVAGAVTGQQKIQAQEQATFNSLLRQGVDLELAMAIAAQEAANAHAAATAAVEQQTFALKQQTALIYARLNGTEDTVRAEQAYTNAIRSGASEAAASALRAATYTNSIAQNMERTASSTRRSADSMRDFADESQRAVEYTSSWDELGIQRQKTSLEAQVERQGFGRVVVGQRSLSGAILSHKIEYDPRQTLTAGIKEAHRATTDNTDAIKENTAATETMADVLSPYYSSDPRRTHLGFRAFAGGGIMTAHGELPLKQYQGGGVASTPQVAVYGEGSTPEAYVPVPSGRIPVEIKQPANNNSRPIYVMINVRGDADANTVSALKSTAFQQAQAMRRAMR